MADTIYIYTHDKFGNPGPYLTTFEQFKADVRNVFGDELANGLTEDWNGITDVEGDVVCVPATPETVQGIYGLSDPLGLRSQIKD